MEQLQQLFKIQISPDQLQAELWYNEPDKETKEQEIEITEDMLTAFIKNNNVLFGLIPANIKQAAEHIKETEFPIVIAKGIAKTDGKDGVIKYSYDTTTEVDRSGGWDFREVMRIPAVKENEKLAVIIPPSEGKNGRSVLDKEIKAKPGKPVRMRPGKNVRFDPEEMTFYAEAEGQVSVGHAKLNVFNVYEIPEDISMKTGNIDFLGNVVIKGNVPTGFSIKATGDIKVFGLVEGASLHAGGSVFVSEGLAGLKNGLIEADEDVHIGYINQGNVIAGNDIFVEHSILHSECSANGEICCKNGNIIGGTLSAGKTITSKDVGNRMNTPTELSFGVNKKLFDLQLSLEKEKSDQEENLKKLHFLSDRLGKADNQDTKTRVMGLKLRKSIELTNEKIKEINEELESINVNLGAIEESYLEVKATLYSSTAISFGKYRRTIDRNYDNVTVRMENNEIVIR